MKRHAPSRISTSPETSAANLFVFLTFVLQFILGWSSIQRKEYHLPVYFHFNQRIQYQNRMIDSFICIGPFTSDVSRDCSFEHQYQMDIFNCYPRGCQIAINFIDINNLTLAGKNSPTEDFTNLKRLLKNRILFFNLEVKCTWVKKDLEWYVNWCERSRWPNDRKAQYPAFITTTKPTTLRNLNRPSWETISSAKLPITSFSPVTHFTWTQKINSTTDFGEQRPNTNTENITTEYATATTLTYPITSTTTSSTKLPITSFTNFSRSTFSSVANLTQTSPLYWQNSNSATDFGEQSLNESNFNYKILWISLGATATVFTLTVSFIIFCQRAKIAKFLRKSENPDVVDDAFYYTDVSMGRRENPAADDSVTYENVVPSLFLNEPNYIELEFNVQENSNPSENAAVEINSTTLHQKRDIKGYVDSVIYAELRK